MSFVDECRVWVCGRRPGRRNEAGTSGPRGAKRPGCGTRDPIAKRRAIATGAGIAKGDPIAKGNSGARPVYPQRRNLFGEISVLSQRHMK